MKLKLYPELPLYKDPDAGAGDANPFFGEGADLHCREDPSRRALPTQDHGDDVGRIETNARAHQTGTAPAAGQPARWLLPPTTPPPPPPVEQVRVKSARTEQREERSDEAPRILRLLS